MAYTYTAEMELACHRQFPLAKTATFRLRQVDRHVQVARPGITDQGSESFQRSCKALVLFEDETRKPATHCIYVCLRSLQSCWLLAFEVGKSAKKRPGSSGEVALQPGQYIVALPDDSPDSAF